MKPVPGTIMSIEAWIALVLLVNLAIYVNLGGTDFGGRYLSLTASGPTKGAQIAALGEAIGPLFAVNHVLFLTAAGLLFVAFPLAPEIAMGPLLVPAVLLFGSIGVRCLVIFVKSRGGSRAVRYGLWRAVFGVVSIVAPLMLGTILGAMSAGGIRVSPVTGGVAPASVTAWLAPFPLAFGGFLLSLFVLLAAVHLVRAAEDPELVEVFRRRALRAAVVVGILAFTTLLLTGKGAPHLSQGLLGRWWSVPFQIITGAAAVGAIFALYQRRDALAWVLVMAQATLVVCGWGLAQQPYLVYPDLEVAGAGGRPDSLTFVLGALSVGTLALFLSFFYPKPVAHARAGARADE